MRWTGTERETTLLARLWMLVVAHTAAGGGRGCMRHAHLQLAPFDIVGTTLGPRNRAAAKVPCLVAPPSASNRHRPSVSANRRVWARKHRQPPSCLPATEFGLCDRAGLASRERPVTVSSSWFDRARQLQRS